MSMPGLNFNNLVSYSSMANTWQSNYLKKGKSKQRNQQQSVYMLHSNPKHIAKYLQKKYFQQLLAVKVFLYKYYMVTVLPVTIGKAF